MKSIERINSTGSVSRVAALIGPSTRALSPSGIKVAFLAAMVLVGMALWSTPAYGQEAAEPVWSADMTVVEYSSVSMGAASGDLFSNVGGSGDLQIKSLWSHIPGRDLRLAFADEVPNAADYTLQVGDLSLEFPADSSAASSFKWHDVDVDWEDGQLIRVRIVLTSESGAQQANTPATGVPTISGTAQVGETLAADTSGIADEDGLDSVSYHYQWIRTDGGADADIADATDSTYTLTAPTAQPHPGGLHRIAQGVAGLQRGDVHVGRDHHALPFRGRRPRRLRPERTLPGRQRIPRTAATSSVPPSPVGTSAAARPVPWL